MDATRNSGRVRYDAWRDRILIEAPAGSMEIRFRWRNTTFLWRGRTYRFTSTIWGRVAILDGMVPVVEGRSTWIGVRLSSVGAEFTGIQRELAVGLAKRSEAMVALIIAAH